MSQQGHPALAHLSLRTAQERIWGFWPHGRLRDRRTDEPRDKRPLRHPGLARRTPSTSTRWGKSRQRKRRGPSVHETAWTLPIPVPPKAGRAGGTWPKVPRPTQMPPSRSADNLSLLRERNKLHSRHVCWTGRYWVKVSERHSRATKSSPQGRGPAHPDPLYIRLRKRTAGRLTL